MAVIQFSESILVEGSIVAAIIFKPANKNNFVDFILFSLKNSCRYVIRGFYGQHWTIEACRRSIWWSIVHSYLPVWQGDVFTDKCYPDHLCACMCIVSINHHLSSR